MSNDQELAKAFNDLERRVANVGGPMIRSYHVREVILTHGYDATDDQIERVLFGDD